MRAQNTGDEIMFGPAILVSPVTTQGATSAAVYLPKAKWYDFWTGESVEGRKRIEADAPLSKLPLFVRAGSIVPMGPAMEWSTEKPADPLEVRVYPGADGDFTLYEDENDKYDYDKGVHATIALHWDDAQTAAHHRRSCGTVSGDAETLEPFRLCSWTRTTESASPRATVPTKLSSTRANRSRSLPRLREHRRRGQVQILLRHL